MKRLILLAVAIAGLACTAPAAARDTAPVLTDVQRLTIVTTAQKATIAQLQAQAAQRDLQALLKSLEVKGFVLDLGTLTYSPEKKDTK